MDMQDRSIEGVATSAAVDFLTVTTKRDPETANMIHSLMSLIPAKEMYDGHSRDWHFMGFHGQARDGCRYGLRGEEGIVMLSGPRAGQWWNKIAPKRQHCTRIDIAVTCKPEWPQTDWAEVAYNEAKDRGIISLSHISNSLGGKTTYFGSRTSRYFGRLYDKAAEQGETPGTLWRYEVEVKKPASEVLVEGLLRSPTPAAWISSFVYNWFEARGHKAFFSPANIDSAIEISANVSTSEKKLEWLASGVRPTVQKLIIAGHEVEVLEALGLSKHLSNRQLFASEVKKWQSEISSE